MFVFYLLFFAYLLYSFSASSECKSGLAIGSTGGLIDPSDRDAIEFLFCRIFPGSYTVSSADR